MAAIQSPLGFTAARRPPSPKDLGLVRFLGLVGEE